MSDLCLVITTCKEYFANVSPLIENIHRVNENKVFCLNNIFIISGQEDMENEILLNNIPVIKVKYTAIQLTGLVYVHEHPERFATFRYFLCLPDTITLGPQFFHLLVEFYNTHVKDGIFSSFPFIHPSIRPTMDIGILHRDHIESMANYLSDIKLSVPTRENRLFLKRRLIELENKILGVRQAVGYEIDESLYDEKKVCPIIKMRHDLIEKLVNAHGRILNEVYFVPFDLYKYQRNFNGITDSLIVEL